MRVLVHHLLRLLTLLVLVTLLVGVPAAVVLVMGVPLPSTAQWRDVWETHRLDLDVVVQVGTILFVVLWAWFAATAVAELVRVLPRRHEPGSLSATRGGGPAGVVRGLVRFMAISSVGAGLVAGGGVGFAAAPSSVVHTVVPGDSYWEIAEGHLDQTLGRQATGHEILVLTETLIADNAPRLGHRDPTLLLPGETVVVGDVTPASTAEPSPGRAVEAPVPVSQPPEPVVPDSDPVVQAPISSRPPPATTLPAAAVTIASPAPASPAPAGPIARSVDVSDDSAFPMSGLVGAAFLATGAMAVLEARRRARLRASLPNDRFAAPTFAHARTELRLRALDDGERIARMDLAVRAASRDVAMQGASIIAIALADSGEVCLFLRGAAVPSSLHWRLDVQLGTWRLPASVALAELAGLARDGVFPCPALVQLGRLDDDHDLYVDLEALGALAVPSEIAGALAASLALSPFRSPAMLQCVAVPGVDGLSGVGSHDATDAEFVVGRAVASAELTALRATGRSTFALRALSVDGEAWEPEIVVIGALPDGVVVSLDGVAEGAGIALVVPESASAPASLRHNGDGFVFEPLGLPVIPVTIDVAAFESVTDLLESIEPCAPVVEVQRVPTVHVPVVRATFVEPDWDLLVRMIGQVEVVSPDGRTAQFVRSKSLELIVWMALHRERPTRSGARADLWEVGVRSATFANVVSEARRALAELQIPADGEDWIGRTLTDDLPLNRRIVTDGDLLRARVEAARGLPHAAAIEVLRPGLELVTGLPFSSPCFAWVDAQGHTSSLVLLATGAATELAQHHLALGDVDGVFWATGRGLTVLAGHEELIALRMRAHAARGDLAGVRLEWEQYERALAADTWSAGEPSPKLVSLRHDLVVSPMAAIVGV